MNEKKRRKLPGKLFFFVCLPLLLCFPVAASTEGDKSTSAKGERVRFNTAFIAEFNKNIDLSWLEEGINIKAGTYRVTIYINDKKRGVWQTRFVESDSGVHPCIPSEVFDLVSLDNEKLPAGWRESHCIDVSKIFNGAKASYDYDSESLAITIPQIYFLHHFERFIDPSRWDEGINALSINYSLSALRRTSNYESNLMYYGNLKTLFRLGAWRFTTQDSFIGGRENNKLQHMQAYAQRAIGSGLSELTIGDFNTRGMLFDTIALRGAILQSDERMLPWEMRGYTPEIKGIANSNAIVTVTQNGNVIYEKNIPPGEFNLTDLTPPGYGGDLEVTVRETNGMTKVFHVPYSSSPKLLRKGYLDYAVASGRMRSYSNVEMPGVLEFSSRYGFLDNLTLYGGGQLTLDKSYLAVSVGAAFDTPAGAVSTELLQSTLVKDINKGNNAVNRTNLKAGLLKRLSEQNTFLSLSGYHNLGDDYYSISEYYTLKQTKDGSDANTRYRNRIEATLSHELSPGWGELSFSGRHDSNNTLATVKSRSSFLVNYRNSYGFVNYALSINKTYTAEGKDNTEFYTNISFPLGATKAMPPRVQAALSYSSSEARLRSTLSHSYTRENHTSSFSGYYNQSSKRQADTGLNITHTDQLLQKSFSYARSLQGYSLGGSTAGAVLIHADGVEFSSYLTDTIALVKAPGGAGASVSGNMYARIKANGYALVPSLSPYEENRLYLDPKGAMLGFEIKDDEHIAIPTAGAVVKVEYKNAAKYEKNELIRITFGKNKYLPFGTRIYDEDESLLGTVGQGGIAIVSLPGKYKKLQARWKQDKKEKTCIIAPWRESSNSSDDNNPGTLLLNCLQEKKTDD